MKIRISGIESESIVDGPGFRYVVFTQGCFHNCLGCHNPQTHDPSKGYFMEIDDIIKEMKKNPLLRGVTLSGGEPFLQPKECSEIAKRVKELKMNVICYTGYRLEELLELKKNNSDVEDLLNNIDILIDGRFILSERDLTLKFRGSRNQRIIDLKETFKQNKVVEILD